jgi:DME family drug/metabolite transporter
MISLIKNSSYGGTIAILVASFLWGTTGTAAAFAPTLGPLAIGAVAMGGGGLYRH